MRIFYYKSRQGNFGDDLNAWMWRELWPQMPAEDADDKLLIGIGTILGMKLPEGNWQKYVVGSGVGYSPLPKLDESWKVLAVRGPLTAAVLGLPEEKAVTDAAILLRALPAYQTQPKNRKGVVFMPHLSAAKAGNWEAVCKIAGVEYLDPRWDSKRLLDKINNAELVLADAMHAAICADVLRVPWIPLASSKEISTFKWMDWTMSMGLSYEPTKLKQSNFLEYIRNKIIFSMVESHQVDKKDIKDLISHYNEIVAEKNRFLVDFTKLLSAGFIYLNRSIIRHFFCIPDIIFRKLAANHLLNVISESKTFLSEEDMYHQKLNNFLGKIELLKD